MDDKFYHGYQGAPATLCQSAPPVSRHCFSFPKNKVRGEQKTKRQKNWILFRWANFEKLCILCEISQHSTSQALHNSRHNPNDTEEPDGAKGRSGSLRNAYIEPGCWCGKRTGSPVRLIHTQPTLCNTKRV